jgi:hypothetical protein
MDTESVTQDPPSLAGLDARLVQQPFGNCEHIIEGLHVRYKQHLGKIAPHVPVAGGLRDALGRADAYCQYRVLGDTVVRCAVHYALAILESGTRSDLSLEQCEDVFRATLRHLEDGRCGPLGSGLVGGLGPDACHGWIWSEERADDVFARSFRYLVQQVYRGPLCTPSTEERTRLARGAELLRELLPLSSRSALSHVHLVACFPSRGAWAGASSSSQFQLSGTIFLCRDGLSSRWWVAEHLLHEALHQQL